jgi:hypothetical protein
VEPARVELAVVVQVHQTAAQAWLVQQIPAVAVAAVEVT